MEEKKQIEKELPNGDIFHLTEIMISNDKDNNRTKIPTKVPIKIKINKNISSVIIFLTHNKELVGFVECNLYEDNKA